jgi:hypothetical protein
MITDIKPESTLIERLVYDDDAKKLSVYFHPVHHTWKKDCTYFYFPESEFLKFISSDSVGKYYLSNIEHFFKTEEIINTLKNNSMAKKSFDKILNLRINVNKINKDWLFKGEKGTYLDVTAFYTEEHDEYEMNGFVTQSVPKKVWEVDRNARGEILGSIKDFSALKRKPPTPEEIPGKEVGTLVADTPTVDYPDDLPF